MMTKMPLPSTSYEQISNEIVAVVVSVNEPLESLHMVKFLLLAEPCLKVKVHSHRAKAKAKISFDDCHLLDSLHMVKVLLLVEPFLQVKVHSHRAEAKVNIS